MNEHDRIDQRFEENLRQLASRTALQPGPNPSVVRNCLNILEQPTTHTWRLTVQTYRKPILWSSMGLAAMVALLATTMWPVAQPTVHAALVVEKLAKQAAASPLMHLTVENLAVDEVQCSARLQLGKSGIAGDVSVRVNNTDDDMPGVIEVDAALGLGGKNNWVLLRKLSIPDPQAQFFINMLLPPGQETLLVLPDEADLGDDFGGDIEEALEALRSGELIDAFKELLANHAEVGATVTNLSDGTIRLSLPIENEEALEAIADLMSKGDSEGEEQAPAVVVEKKVEGKHSAKSHSAKSHSGKSHSAKVHVEHAHQMIEKHHKEHVEHGAKEIIGATVNVIYDPTTEAVRMLEILGLGSPDSKVSLVLSEGDIDPTLLDSARAAKPGVRTLDLGAIEQMIKGFENMHGGKKE